MENHKKGNQKHNCAFSLFRKHNYVFGFSRSTIVFFTFGKRNRAFLLSRSTNVLHTEAQLLFHLPGRATVFFTFREVQMCFIRKYNCVFHFSGSKTMKNTYVLHDETQLCFSASSKTRQNPKTKKRKRKNVFPHWAHHAARLLTLHVCAGIPSQGYRECYISLTLRYMVLSPEALSVRYRT